MANKFKCPKGHDFESTRNIRAFCPECGSNANRQYGEAPKSEPVQEPPSEQTEPDIEPTTPEETDKPKPDAETTKKKPEPPKVKKVKVVRKVKPVAKEPEKPQRKIIKKKAGSPQIKTRVKTNVEKKRESEVKGKGSTWDQVRKAGWF